MRGRVIDELVFIDEASSIDDATWRKVRQSLVAWKQLPERANMCVFKDGSGAWLYSSCLPIWDADQGWTVTNALAAVGEIKRTVHESLKVLSQKESLIVNPAYLDL